MTSGVYTNQLVQKSEIATARWRPAEKKKEVFPGSKEPLLPTQNTCEKVDRKLTVERLKKKKVLV